VTVSRHREERAEVKILTIGFTQKSAETFFTSLRQARVRRLVDVRLNNVSQLAGFTKRDDLRYFLRTICGIEYLHLPDLAPTAEILDRYRAQKSSGWDLFEKQFLELMRSRRVEEKVDRRVLDGGCLLCSEEEPLHCHRRLVAEYLKDRWGDVEIEHLP
jgi:uncharacterized protein (DUF488 family)